MGLNILLNLNCSLKEELDSAESSFILDLDLILRVTHRVERHIMCLNFVFPLMEVLRDTQYAFPVKEHLRK